MSVESLVRLSLPAAGAATGDRASELEAVRESIFDVLDDTCTSSAIHEFIDGKNTLADDLWQQAIDLGWQAAVIPEAYNGLDLADRGFIALNAALGSRLAPGPMLSAIVALRFLARFADSGTQERLFAEALSSGLRIAIPASLEPPTPLRLDAGGISGTIQLFGAADSSYALVPVMAGSDGRQWALIACGPDGASLEAATIWDLTRDLCLLSCDHVAPLTLVPDAQGVATRSVLSDFCLALAADSLGGATTIADQTVDYMKERKQFGLPIGAFQALKHRAANFVAKIATSRHLLEHAIEAAEKEDPDAAMWAVLAKASASDCYAFVAGDSVQLHGGVGHTWEFDVHIHVKRARLNQALAADNNVCRDLAADAFVASLR